MGRREETALWVGALEPVVQAGVPIAAVDHRSHAGGLSADIGQKVCAGVDEQKPCRVHGCYSSVELPFRPPRHDVDWLGGLDRGWGRFNPRILDDVNIVEDANAVPPWGSFPLNFHSGYIG